MIFLISCSEESCDTSTQAALCLDDIGCTNSIYSVSLNSTNEFELIQSEEDYQRLVNSTCEVNIDWGVNDLVIGNLGLTNGLVEIEKTTRMDCPSNQLYLNLTFILNETTVAPLITWNALIPKLSDEETIFVLKIFQ